MGEGVGERDGDWGGDSDLGSLGGDGDLGVGEGDLGVGEREIWGEMGIWVVETVMWRVVKRRIWGVGIFAYFAKQGEFWERVEGELVSQGNQHIVVCPCFSLDL